ncbi:hypothetical protein MMC26_006360 [Xylographa opegraphella]|nr:hypothetical protein [Xylographa opegraphella]
MTPKKPTIATTKTSFTLENPFPTIPWPIVSDETKIIILEQLCSLLEPIGKRRLEFVQPSKGKRKKRKRSNAKIEKQKDSLYTNDQNVSEQDQLSNVPPEPEVASFLTIGFNSTERALEAASHDLTARSLCSTTTAFSESRLPQMVAVFVDRADQTHALYAHLPLLVSTASFSLPSEAGIRLVALPRGATGRLSAALHIPRAGMIGLYGNAPGSAPLVDFVRKHVSTIEVPWLKRLREGLYIPVEISTKQIAVSKQSNKLWQSANPSLTAQPQV